MGDELRHLNSACGCTFAEENVCEENNNTCGSCGCFGGSWLWIILIFIFFFGCGNTGGMCGINSCSIDCGDLVTIIIIILVLNCICGDKEGGLLSNIF